VKADNVDYNKVHGLLREDGVTTYAACATMYLLIFASGGAAPLQVTLRVPVETLAMVEDKPVAMGNFNIDLTQLGGISHIDQTLFVYAYAKDWTAEPVTIGLVDRTPKH
jgi:hypothetical protein